MLSLFLDLEAFLVALEHPSLLVDLFDYAETSFIPALCFKLCTKLPFYFYYNILDFISFLNFFSFCNSSLRLSSDEDLEETLDVLFYFKFFFKSEAFNFLLFYDPLLLLLVLLRLWMFVRAMGLTWIYRFESPFSSSMNIFSFSCTYLPKCFASYSCSSWNY